MDSYRGVNNISNSTSNSANSNNGDLPSVHVNETIKNQPNDHGYRVTVVSQLLQIPQERNRYNDHGYRVTIVKQVAQDPQEKQDNVPAHRQHLVTAVNFNVQNSNNNNNLHCVPVNEAKKQQPNDHGFRVTVVSQLIQVPQERKQFNDHGYKVTVVSQLPQGLQEESNEIDNNLNGEMNLDQHKRTGEESNKNAHPKKRRISVKEDPSQ